MDERWSLIALHQIKGVGWYTIQKLHQVGWKPGEMIRSEHLQTLLQLGVSSKIIQEIKSTYGERYIEKIASKMDKMGIEVITFLDQEYPELLREIAQPPWVLYVLGDSSLLHTPCLAVVGTRKPTPYGKNAVRLFVGELAQKGWTIVSGMALGIDGQAHESALHENGKTIAVLGCGVDVIYPRQHRGLYQRIKEKGLIVSEMPPGTTPHPGLFPQRNRIVSALSRGVLIVEAAEKSGSLITADFALEQGKDVFAIPGSIFSSQSRGTNQLIQQGAKCVLSPKEIWEEYEHLVATFPMVASTKKEEHPITELEKRVLSCLRNDEPVQITELLEQLSDLQIGEVHQTLLQLEMKQIIQQLPGSRYISM